VTDDQDPDFRIACFEEDVIWEFLQIRSPITGGVEMVAIGKLSNSLNRGFQFNPEAIMDAFGDIGIPLSDGLDVVPGLRVETQIHSFNFVRSLPLPAPTTDLARPH